MSRSPYILIVEDDADISDYISNELKEVDPDIKIKVVKDRDSAISLLNSDDFFDLLSLDLTILSSSSSTDKKIEYGSEVLHHCNQAAPGLPIVILTASTSDDLVSDFLDSSDKADVWGEGQKRSTVDHVQKKRLDKYEEKLNHIIKAIRNLHDVEIVKMPAGLSLEIRDDRLIRIFAKRNRASRCEISKISGGLSEANVYRISLYDASGIIILRAIAKIGKHDTIDTEDENFNSFIKRLRPEATPRHLETNVFGAKDRAAVFYGLADDHDIDFFNIAKSGKISESLAANVKNLTDKWVFSSSETRKKIKDIRRLLVSDNDANQFFKTYNLDWAAREEDQSVQVKWGCIHADLHGKNILINENKECGSLIDYGDIKEGPISLDPITLEFSNFFHPDGVDTGGWPSQEQAKQFLDVSKYIAGCPIPDIINFYRSWLEEVSVANRDKIACAYSYFLRQLKYPDTNKDLALAFLEGCRRLFEQN